MGTEWGGAVKADWESRESLFVNQLSGKFGLTKIFWSFDNICVDLIEKISETLDTSTITKCAEHRLSGISNKDFAHSWH